MSDIETGNVLISNAPFNLLDQINSIEFIYSELAKSKGLHFSVNFDIKNHFNVIGDQARMTQVLNDLLSNTFKYVPTGSEISFEVILDKIVYNRAYYTFIIEYSSELVDEEFQDVMLNTFTNGTLSHAEVFNESSLGLSLCKNIIDLLGGHISATPNEQAKGIRSEVNISFDLPAKLDFINERNSSVKTVGTLSRKNALVVDGNYSNYGTIKSLLEKRDITVELAINGLEAIEIFEKSTPHYYDFILMDIEMPAMTGFDAAKAIRNSFHEQSQTIPIIAMTLNKFAEDLALSISVGINDYILKPIDANKLFSVLNNYI
jgi:CheY-like chemotaxis protein